MKFLQHLTMGTLALFLFGTAAQTNAAEIKSFSLNREKGDDLSIITISGEITSKVASL